MLRRMKPGRSSTTADSKSCPAGGLHIDAGEREDELLGVIATFSTSDFNEHDGLPVPPRGTVYHVRAAMSPAGRQDREGRDHESEEKPSETPRSIADTSGKGHQRQ